jgi:hypothetical protein
MSKRPGISAICSPWLPGGRRGRPRGAPVAASAPAGRGLWGCALFLGGRTGDGLRETDMAASRGGARGKPQIRRRATGRRGAGCRHAAGDAAAWRRARPSRPEPGPMPPATEMRISYRWLHESGRRSQKSHAGRRHAGSVAGVGVGPRERVGQRRARQGAGGARRAPARQSGPGGGHTTGNNRSARRAAASRRAAYCSRLLDTISNTFSHSPSESAMRCSCARMSAWRLGSYWRKVVNALATRDATIALTELSCAFDRGGRGGKGRGWLVRQVQVRASSRRASVACSPRPRAAPRTAPPPGPAAARRTLSTASARNS